jgi:MFS transporter, DHA2 family, multidrug resistance protein
VTSSEPRDRFGEYLPLHGLNLVLLTIAISIASFMEILDMTIVNVSVPSIAGSLAVSPSEGTWAISSYMLAAAVVQPLTGWIGRQFGEVRTFVSSALLFVLFSALCGLATSMPMLIASRLIQGLVSGPMMSVGQALLLRNYPVKLRGLALGLWAMVVIIAPIFGPIMGGWITDNLSWPWLFYINVPVGIIAALIIGVVLRHRESSKMKTPLDAVGLLLLVAGVGSLQFMLDNGNDKDWFHSAEIVTAAVVSVVALGLMIPWELTDRHPVVDLHLLQRRNFLIGCLTIAVAYFGFMGLNVVFPLWLQTTLGYTSTWAGLAMAPIGVLALMLAPLIGRNLHRINLRAAASFAFLVFAVNVWWTAGLNETASFHQLALPRLFQGLGVPLFFLPLNQIIMSGVSPAELASAAGLSNFIRTMSGSIATAVSVYLWNTRTDYHHAVLTEHVRPDSPAWIAFQDGLARQGVAAPASYAYTDHLVTQQAMTLGVNDVFMLLAVAFLVLIPFVWFARPPFGAPGTGGGVH